MNDCIAAVVSFNIYSAKSDVVLPDLALANVEALANGEWGTGSNCRWSSDWTVCNVFGKGLGCPCGYGQ